MAGLFADARAMSRRVVHDTMSVEASYIAPGASVGTLLNVRQPHKMGLAGDMSNDGYPEVMVGIDTVIFDREELVSKSVVPVRLGRVVLGDGTVLSLESRHPYDGPIKEVWSVRSL
jgi:hypothetical protein